MEYLSKRGLNLVLEQIKEWLKTKVNKKEGYSLLADVKQQAYDDHLVNYDNPHQVTKGQVGLGNCDNTSDIDKPVSTAQAVAIADAKKAGTDAQETIDAHKVDYKNPHQVTKAQVGLGNCDNTSDINKPISTLTQLALDTKVDKSQRVNGHPLVGDIEISKADVGLSEVENIAPMDMPVSTKVATELSKKADKSTRINGHALDKDVVLSKGDIGLSNVDNTSDVDKPISNATQQALDTKADKNITINGYSLANNITLNKSDIGLSNVTNDAQVKRSEMGVANGVALLGSDGKLDSSQLPSHKTVDGQSIIGTGNIDFSAYAKQSWVNNQLTYYVTNDNLSSTLNNYVTSSYLSNSYYSKNEITSNYYTKSEVDDAIANAGTDYTLPVATDTILGGVKVVGTSTNIWWLKNYSVENYVAIHALSDGTLVGINNYAITETITDDINSLTINAGININSDNIKGGYISSRTSISHYCESYRLGIYYDYTQDVENLMYYAIIFLGDNKTNPLTSPIPLKPIRRYNINSDKTDYILINSDFGSSVVSDVYNPRDFATSKLSNIVNSVYLYAVTVTDTLTVAQYASNLLNGGGDSGTSSYTLPISTTSILGGIKAGSSVTSTPSYGQYTHKIKVNSSTGLAYVDDEVDFPYENTTLTVTLGPNMTNASSATAVLRERNVGGDWCGLYLDVIYQGSNDCIYYAALKTTNGTLGSLIPLSQTYQDHKYILHNHDFWYGEFPTETSETVKSVVDRFNEVYVFAIKMSDIISFAKNGVN